MPTKKAKYSKMDPIEHILTRPDMYVGSTRSREVEEFVVVDENYHIAKRTVNIAPAVLRLFIEPLSNAIDNVARSKQSGTKMTKIAITIDEKTGETTFWNDGDVIPIELHPEEKCYNHSMIFGQLLTGSNYNDEEDRLEISGKNGLGIKCVNVFSTSFTVEGADPEAKQILTQTWTKNMTVTEEPSLSAYKLKKGYTKITYTPDFARFGLENYTPDILAVYKRLMVDAAMITKVVVEFNGMEIPVTNLLDYAKLYDDREEHTDEILSLKTASCEVVIMPAEAYEVVSFANGVYTPQGGVHVSAWDEAIFRPIVEKFNKPKKPPINIADVRQFFRLFVVANVNKPEFDSQSKLRLEGPPVQAEVKKTHISTICKWSVMERLEDIIRLKELAVIKKTERKKRGYERVEGLEPANNEGGKEGYLCTLILVEGLSAKTYVSNGIAKGVFGRAGPDWNGILALRGKILNTRNSTASVIANNKVLSSIIKALNLQLGVDYTVEENYRKLRYGRVLVITDADVDGRHICGLIQNIFHYMYPTLLKRDPPFLTSMQTPIVRVKLAKGDRIFYDEREYLRYVKEFQEKFPHKRIDKKYYKGLGATNEDDVVDTFGQKMVQFIEDEQCNEAMNLAFSNKLADRRKDWLEQYDPEKTVLKWNGNEPEVKDMKLSDYIHTELIQFSIDDCQRSIPSLLDGLKQSQRKILYACFLRKLNYNGQTLKVAQLSGYVAEKTNYHHGEDNLKSTIVGMAQSFIGSNNIPLLFRDGQFGSRVHNGKDAANARYIYTKLDALTRLIFRPEDDVLLDNIEDDGDKVEPRFYVPIIPMILVNGCIGIGTGWSCNIPCYNPLEVIEAVRAWLENDGKVLLEEEGTIVSLLPELAPWYRDHTGPMLKENETRFVSWGIVQPHGKKVRVTELPVGLATEDFKEILDDMWEKKEINNYVKGPNWSPKTIDYIITPSEDLNCTAENLSLYKAINTTNMVLFTEEGRLKRFANTDQIIDAFCQVRYRYYTKRRQYMINNLEQELKVLGNKKRFLQEVRDGDFVLFEVVDGKRQSRKAKDIVKELRERKYDEEHDEEEDGDKHGYGYLLRLQINSITAERINQLEKDIASREKELDSLRKKNEKMLWLDDLNELEQAYRPWLEGMSKEKVVTKKKPTK